MLSFLIVWRSCWKKIIYLKLFKLSACLNLSIWAGLMSETCAGIFCALRNETVRLSMLWRVCLCTCVQCVSSLRCNEPSGCSCQPSLTISFYFIAVKSKPSERTSGPDGSTSASRVLVIWQRLYGRVSALLSVCVFALRALFSSVKLELSMQSYVKWGSEILLWHVILHLKLSFFYYHTCSFYYEHILIERLHGILKKLIYHTTGPLKWTREGNKVHIFTLIAWLNHLTSSRLIWDLALVLLFLIGKIFFWASLRDVQIYRPVNDTVCCVCLCDCEKWRHNLSHTFPSVC